MKVDVKVHPTLAPGLTDGARVEMPCADDDNGTGGFWNAGETVRVQKLRWYELVPLTF